MKFDNASDLIEYMALNPKYGFKDDIVDCIGFWLSEECIFCRLFLFNSNGLIDSPGGVVDELSIPKQAWRRPGPNGKLLVKIYDIGFDEYFIYIKNIEQSDQYYIVNKNKKWHLK